MGEYIVQVPDEQAEQFVAKYGIEGTQVFGFQLTGEIVRCRDCAHWATEARFTGMCVGKRFNPNGFCAWGVKRKEGGEC